MSAYLFKNDKSSQIFYTLKQLGYHPAFELQPYFTWRELEESPARRKGR